MTLRLYQQLYNMDVISEDACFAWAEDDSPAVRLAPTHSLTQRQRNTLEALTAHC
jgi:hypothetical protein